MVPECAHLLGVSLQRRSGEFAGLPEADNGRNILRSPALSVFSAPHDAAARAGCGNRANNHFLSFGPRHGREGQNAKRRPPPSETLALAGALPLSDNSGGYYSNSARSLIRNARFLAANDSTSSGLASFLGPGRER